MKELWNIFFLSFLIPFTPFLTLELMAADIVVNQDTVWEQGSFTYDNVVVTNGAKLTFNGAVTLNCVNLTIDAGASISADEKGYPGKFLGTEDNGPGGGTSSNNAGNAYSIFGSGGGYGGKGGDTFLVGGGVTYGNSTVPVDVGSGGGRAKSNFPGSDVRGGSGGGAVNLQIANVLVVNGSISANGGPGISAAGDFGSGGGSGGSVSIRTLSFSGTGSIAANGGQGGPGISKTGGGGGGGRVAVYAQTSSFSGVLQALGAGGYQAGDEGSVVQFLGSSYENPHIISGKVDLSGTYHSLSIDKGALNVPAGAALSASSVDISSANFTVENGAVFTATDLRLSSQATVGNRGDFSVTNMTFDTGTFVNDGTLSWGTPQFLPGVNVLTNNGTMNIPQLVLTNLKLNQRGQLVIADNRITVDPAGELVADAPMTFGDVVVNNGGTITHSLNGDSDRYHLSMTAGNLTVNAGGSINVSGMGFQGHLFSGTENNGLGGGASGSGFYNTTGGGGGYGGRGGMSRDALGGLTYGSSAYPVEIGSGGGRAKGSNYTYYGVGGNGGGAVSLVVLDGLILNGSISANGDAGNTAGGAYGSGGGSGGSVFITTKNFSGTGLISVDGGAGGQGTETGRVGGGGSGGRVAVYYQNSTFSGAIHADGGNGYARGENGTTVISQSGLSITPDRGGDTGSVTVTIAGGPFAEGSTVRLAKSSEQGIAGQGTSVGNNGLTLTTTFDLEGRTRGAWDVVITSPDNNAISIPSGFAIEEGQAPELWADLIGREVIALRREQKYWIVLGNSGNIDIPEANLFLEIVGDVAQKLDDEDEFISLPGGERQIVDYNVRPGESRIIPLVLKSNSSDSFQISLSSTANPVDIDDLNGRLKDPAGVPAESISLTAVSAAPSAGTAVLDYEETYPKQIRNPYQSIPAGYIIDGEVCLLGFVCQRQQGISIGNGKIRWSYADVGGTEEIALSDVINNVDGLHGKFRFKSALRPDPTWGKDKDGIVQSPEGLIPLVDQATAFLVRDEFGNPRQIPFPTPEGIRAFKEKAYNGTNQKLIDLADQLTDELAAISHYDETNFISCFDAAVSALNASIDEYNDFYTTRITIYKIGGQDNATFAAAIKKRNKTERSIFNYDFPKIKKNILQAIQFFIQSVAARDPNDKVGPHGVGLERFISSQEPLRYTILFENVETATAPAQEVVVTDQLDMAHVDLNTFSFGPVSFGDHVVTSHEGVKEFISYVDLRPGVNLKVRVEGKLDMNSGLVTWKFTSIDPQTNSLPEDPLTGFLPPNVTPPEGDGNIVFTVRPLAAIPTGVVVRNNATIIFDLNDPIDTPEWFNTIDSASPVSAVLPLAAEQRVPNFLVQWSGTDEGSGVEDYSVFVSEDGGAFTPWLEKTTDTAAYFMGQAGKTYSFYSIARDQTGNVELTPPLSDATTRVVLNSPPEAVNDSYVTDEDVTLTILPEAGVLGNDADPENDSLTAIIVNGAAHGQLTFNSDGSFTYTPQAEFFGTDSFSYRANDGEFDSGAAIVTLTVNPVNDAPVAHAGTDQMTACTSPSGTQIVLDGSSSSDIENNPLTYLWTWPLPPGEGTATGVSPSASFPIGGTAVSLVVNDGNLNSAADVVNVTVTVGVAGFQSPLAGLAPEGSEVILPDKAFKQGSTLPLKLQLLCGSAVLTDNDVNPPRIVSIIREGEAINLETIDPAAGQANDNGYLFRYSDPQWIYNLSTKNLGPGTYSIAIEMPDGQKYMGGFVLR